MRAPKWLARLLQPGPAKLSEPLRWGVWVGGNNPATTEVTDESYLRAYENPWVYACASRIASAAASVPLVVSTLTGPNRTAEPGELGRLLRYMNAAQNTQGVVQLTALHMALYGNAYWLLLRKSPDSTPQSIQVVSPDIVKAIPGQSRYNPIVGAYTFRVSQGSSQRVSADDVVHFKLPSASDMYYGQSPVKALEQVLNTWVHTQKYNEAYFRRGGVPTGVLQGTVPLTEDQRTLLRESWDMWRSADAVGRPLILGNDLTYTPLGNSTDATVTKTYPEMLRDLICSVFGVPPAVVGIFEYANYANSHIQRRLFWSETILPMYLRPIEQTIAEHLVPQFSGAETYEVAFDTSGVEALQPELGEKAAQATQLTAGGIWTINEARRKLFGLGPVPWGDVFWGTFAQVPLASIDGPAPPVVSPPDEAEEQPQPTKGGQVEHRRATTRRLDPAGRAAYWRSRDKQRRTKERIFAAACRDWHDDLAAEVFANLDQQSSKISHVRAPDGNDILFDLRRAVTALAKATDDPLRSAYATAAETAAKLIGAHWSPDTAAQQRLIKQRHVRMRTVPRTAQDALRQSLAEGIAAGENVEALKDRVRQWNTTGKEHHVENVARTEVGSVMTQAAVHVYAEHRFGCEWVTVQDERTRDDHAEMDGVTVGPDELFTLPDGVRCSGPGDPTLPPEHVCNCRCDVVPWAGAENDGTD